MVFIRLCKFNEELGGARNEKICTQVNNNNNNESTKERKISAKSSDTSTNCADQ